MSVILGIDVGTSGSKITAIDQNGCILADTVRTYKSSFPQIGYSEQNPDDWWNAVSDGIKYVISIIGNGNISAVGLSGQMHGTVLLDKNDNVIRPAILWNDQRTAKECDEIIKAAGGSEALLSKTNNAMLTGYTAGKLLWLKKNEPENYSKIKHLLLPKDYIRFRLTGEYLTDVSDASGTGVYDVKNRCYRNDIINAIGLDPAIFPKALESVDIAGLVSRSGEKSTGIKAGCPVSAGGGDAVIANVGLGLISPGKAAVTIGTSGVVSLTSDGYFENEQGKLQMFCGTRSNSWHVMGAALTAAGAYKWFASEFSDGGDGIYRRLDSLASKVTAGSENLTFLPFLTGERCPFYDPKAKGSFIGITERHSRAHFARAIMEGVAFSLKSIFELVSEKTNVSRDEIIIAGGGASSPLWRQITADVFGMPVKTVMGSEQGGGYAAALLAGVTAGIFPSLEYTSSLIEPKEKALPDSERAKVYSECYKKYLKLYDSLKWYWNE